MPDSCEVILVSQMCMLYILTFVHTISHYVLMLIMILQQFLTVHVYKKIVTFVNGIYHVMMIHLHIPIVLSICSLILNFPLKLYYVEMQTVLVIFTTSIVVIQVF